MSVRLRRTPKKNKEKRGAVSTPLPEAIDGGQWEIKGSGHRRDALAELHPEGGGRLTIPLGGGEIERAMRLHEQMHAAITPRDPEAWDGVDPTVLELCEDRRVHQGLAIEGFQEQLETMAGLAEDMAIEWRRLEDDYRKADRARDKAGRSLKQIPPRAIVGARVIASYKTGLFKSEFNAAVNLDPEAAHFGHTLARQLDGSRLRPFSEAKTAAELLCEIFGTPGNPDIGEEKEKPRPDLGEGFLEALTRMRERERERKAGGIPSALEGDSLRGPTEKAWPKMEIIEKPRPLRMKVTMRGGYRKLPEVRGRSLRRVARLAQDGRVFRAKHPVRRRGGSVLIDCSGSMNLSSQDVEAILIALPAAVVATYNGDGSRGELWVIARDGKRAVEDDLRSDMGGNVVDVPALQWLNEQRGPRYWVCDGIVTEHNDRQTARVVAACHELQRRGNVIRVGEVDVLLAREGWERLR